ncbi:hypothetical protein [Halorubrum vacuolatum]|uniref:Uncharacterized protein n=1 Tax=Halorubrum vacuolatum TaxID=63740 RepID=A0A238VLP8_HALVU|nr:hypothetical protein [Halorubrum vacuolatum]SNR35310.1 hypothetical protein SAMN06264855_103107 [Halorubrum vacuolatum]
MGIVGRFVRKWVVKRLLFRNPIVFAVVWIVSRLHRGRRLAKTVPLATYHGGERIDADFLDRREIADRTAPAPDGVMDDLNRFARGEDAESESEATDDPFDPEAVHPAIRACCERTAAHRTVRRVRWRRGLRLVGGLFGRVAREVGQFSMPGRDRGFHPVHGQFLAVRSDEDPREDVRGWVRTDDAGDVVSLGLYGGHVAAAGEVTEPSDDAAGPERFLNAAFPLPGATLSVVARPRHVPDRSGGWLGRVGGWLGRRASIGRGSEGASGTGLEWTTTAAGHPGVYLRLPAVALKLPLSVRVRLTSAPSRDGDEVSAATEVRLYGVRLLRIDHRVAPA